MENALRDKVVSTIYDNFGSADVNLVQVDDGFDSEGDAVFNIVVVIENQVSKVNPSELVGLTRHIRATLREFTETRFPIVTVMTANDWKKQVDEAA